MSPRGRGDTDWARDIVEAVQAIRAAERAVAAAGAVAGGDLEVMHVDAITFRLMSIGEAAKNLSGLARETHPEVPWRDIGRLRDMLAHHDHRRDGQVVLAVARDGFLDPLLAAARVIADGGPQPPGSSPGA